MRYSLRKPRCPSFFKVHCYVPAATMEYSDKDFLETASVNFIQHKFEKLSILETFYDKNFSSTHVTLGREVVNFATDGG